MTKTYRSPVQDVLVPIFGFLFLILSPTPALAGPGKGGTTGEVFGVLVAILIAGLGLALIICQASNRLIVAENGLTYRHNLRTRKIAWTDIQTVGVMRAKSGGSWWWLQVQTRDQQTAIKSVTGTRKYVDGVAGEIRTQVDGQRQS